MSIPIFVVVIEKTEAAYTAYTPNISRVSATATSREEVERLIIEQMTSYLERLEAQHSDSQRRWKITTAPLAEKVTCRYTWGGKSRWRDSCRARAQNEGLCCQHWRLLYGHEIKSKEQFKKCQLCDEEDPLKLANWNERCVYKAANDDWAAMLATKRQAEVAAIKESKAAAARLKRAQQSPRQCSATLSQRRKGVRCSKEAVQ